MSFVEMTEKSHFDRKKKKKRGKYHQKVFFKKLKHK